MQFFREFVEAAVLNSPSVFTFGNFDGVHLGHQYLFNTLLSTAKERGMASALLTFQNHPLEIIKPDTVVPRLCTLEQKRELLASFNFDAIVDIPFTKELANLSATQFFTKVQTMLAPKMWIVGQDVAFGRAREGNKEFLSKMCAKGLIELTCVDPFCLQGLRVSSSIIRKAIIAGDLSEASMLLGRPYSIYSKVIPGIGEGRKIGTPTINIDVGGLCLPPCGVWAARVRLGSAQVWQKAAAYLGRAPTLQNRAQPVLEVHLLEGIPLKETPQFVEVRLQKFIRPDQKFADTQALIHQIQEDLKQLRSYFITQDF